MTALFATQAGTGPTNSSNCSNPSPHNCLLSNCTPLLHAFFINQNQQQDAATTEQDIDLLPCSLAFVKTIQLTPATAPLHVLFDSGLDSTFIHQKALPLGATPHIIN
jgi:hypothetical protein